MRRDLRHDSAASLDAKPSTWNSAADSEHQLRCQGYCVFNGSRQGSRRAAILSDRRFLPKHVHIGRIPKELDIVCCRAQRFLFHHFILSNLSPQSDASWLTPGQATLAKYPQSSTTNQREAFSPARNQINHGPLTWTRSRRKMTRMQQKLSLQKGRFFPYLLYSSFGEFVHYTFSLSHLASPSSYSTRFELFIDFIGIVAAVAAGAAQVYVLHLLQDGDT